MASFRFGVEWSALDHIESAAEISIPVLLFHGGADEYAPVASSREYADLVGDLATLIVIDGAGHGEAWNFDPTGYEAALADFLQSVMAEPNGDEEA
jgi:hypothetical protein